MGITPSYYLLHLADGSEVEVSELPDFNSHEPVKGDSPRGEIEEGTVAFIPAFVVWIEAK